MTNGVILHHEAPLRDNGSKLTIPFKADIELPNGRIIKEQLIRVSWSQICVQN